MSVNKVILIGHLGKDPELKYTAQGTAVANFSLACTEKFKDKAGEKQERTEWVNIVAWGQLAEICGKWLTKGKQVYCEGRLQSRSYDDRDGNKRYITEVVIDTMQMLGGKEHGGGHGGVSGEGQGVSGGAERKPLTGQDLANGVQPYDDNDEIPF